MRIIRNIIIHCAATPNGDARFDTKWIDAEHRKPNPRTGKKAWRMIGYHYVIEIDGTLHEGRPVEEIGAHVSGSNADSIGVCMVGTDRFSEQQWSTLRDLVTTLTERYHEASVWGHRDFSPDRDGDGIVEPIEWLKTCPGFDVSDWRTSGMDPQWNLAHIWKPS